MADNVAPGCCMVFNRAAAELINQHPVPEAIWHDWWAHILGAGDIPGHVLEPRRRAARLGGDNVRVSDED
jgi:hypothetical protein